MMIGLVRGGLMGVVLLGVASCAPASAPLGDAAGLAVVRSAGTIVAMRRVVLPPEGPFVGGGVGGFSGTMDGADLRLNVLGAFGLLGGGAQAVEFIVREDGATQPVSVVQSDDGGLRPGERVVLIRGPHPRVARAGA